MRLTIRLFHDKYTDACTKLEELYGLGKNYMIGYDCSMTMQMDYAIAINMFDDNANMGLDVIIDRDSFEFKFAAGLYVVEPPFTKVFFWYPHPLNSLTNPEYNFHKQYQYERPVTPASRNRYSAPVIKDKIEQFLEFGDLYPKLKRRIKYVEND